MKKLKHPTSKTKIPQNNPKIHINLSILQKKSVQGLKKTRKVLIVRKLCVPLHCKINMVP